MDTRGRSRLVSFKWIPHGHGFLAKAFACGNSVVRLGHSTCVKLVSAVACLVSVIFREMIRRTESRTLSLARAAGTDRLKGVEDGENVKEVYQVVGAACSFFSCDVVVCEGASLEVLLEPVENAEDV